MSTSVHARDPATVAVVVEVQSAAPQSDWPELSSLLRAYLAQCFTVSQETRTPFPFPPGERVQWGEGTDRGKHRPDASHSDGSAFSAPPSVLMNSICALRVSDMTDPNALRVGSLHGTNRAPSLVFEPIFFFLHKGGNAEGHPGHEDEAAAEEEGLPSSTVLRLPDAGLEGLWESLSYGESITTSILMKKDLVEYVYTAMTFSAAGVDAHCISWNRMVLLHGPPGTGKTSLCKALAHKLAVRLCGVRHSRTFPHPSPTGTPLQSHPWDRRDRHTRQSSPPPPPPPYLAPVHAQGSAALSLFATATLVEVNAHSLFSRWFSESGKQVMLLFQRIRALAADPRCLVCVVLDEVESLAAARQSAMKGNEPSDSIRVVNALLTQMDSLQHMRNVLVLATSNLTGAIDVAFLDRADKKVYIGPPGLEARRTMLQAAVTELLKKGLIHFPATASAPHEVSSQPGMTPPCQGEGGDEEGTSSNRGPLAEATLQIENIAAACTGFNGRLLKRLPFLAYGACVSAGETHGTASLPAGEAATRVAPSLESLSRLWKPTFIGAEMKTRVVKDRRSAVPSVPVFVYLDYLREAAVREKEGHARMTATTQHLTRKDDT